jgi:choline dehydrogenase-like flavoprotein
MIAAEAGLSVVVLEAGAFIPPGEMNQREERMFPRLFWDSGNRTTVDRAIRIVQGRGVGGSSLHNLNLCKRIPEPILARWRREQGLERLTREAMDRLYAEAETLLTVGPVPEEAVSAHNRFLRDATRALGWAGGPLRHNRTGCVGSGFCELGCAFDAKNNALKVAIPRAVRAGAEVITECQAVRVDHDGRKVRGVLALSARGAIEVRAPRVCVAASATATAALLLRSRVPDASGRTGRTLHIHPAVVAAGELDQEVRAAEGIPQSYECTEHLDLEHESDPAAHRTWIVPAFAHPVGASTLLPGVGAVHRRWMECYPRLAVLTAMIHDRTAGEVTPDGELRLRIDYRPVEEDRRELAFGAAALARLLFAGGAKRVLIPFFDPIVIERGDEAAIAALEASAIPAQRMALSAVHPLGTVPMGDDPKRAPVDSAGRHHQIDGLFVSDGSLFLSSIGVPPQLSIYALGLHVGRAIASAQLG